MMVSEHSDKKYNIFSLWEVYKLGCIKTKQRYVSPFSEEDWGSPEEFLELLEDSTEDSGGKNCNSIAF